MCILATDHGFGRVQHRVTMLRKEAVLPSVNEGLAFPIRFPTKNKPPLNAANKKKEKEQPMTYLKHRFVWAGALALAIDSHISGHYVGPDQWRDHDCHALFTRPQLESGRMATNVTGWRSRGLARSRRVMRRWQSCSETMAIPPASLSTWNSNRWGIHMPVPTHTRRFLPDPTNYLAGGSSIQAARLIRITRPV